MVVMPANNSSGRVHWWAGKWPGRIGHLYGPGGQRGPYPWIPYALDNGAFKAYQLKQPFDGKAFTRLLNWAQKKAAPPMWCAVPDVVADRDGTLRSWDQWFPELVDKGWDLAFVVQDGMTPDDVPPTADIVFVGGTKQWKRETVPMWTSVFPRVHVGRVNSEADLWLCHNHGCESCDSSGWFMGDTTRLEPVEAYLRSTELPAEEELV